MEVCYVGKKMTVLDSSPGANASTIQICVCSGHQIHIAKDKFCNFVSNLLR